MNDFHVLLCLQLLPLLQCFMISSHVGMRRFHEPTLCMSSITNNFDDKEQQYPRNASTEDSTTTTTTKRKKVIIVGAGWGGLSAAHALSKEPNVDVTVIEASPRVGGLVRDGYTTMSGTRPAEAGQHGFWNNYHNIFRLLREEIPKLEMTQPSTRTAALTEYAEQGQYSPRGLEAVWPVYQRQQPQLPTGLAQAAYTRFLNLSLWDRCTAVPLVLAFSEFDDSPAAWDRYDPISFRDLCVKLGVSRRCYEEAFEPMILTGLFAPGAQCSAAAALGMAYFFVLQSQSAFDVRWCRGNIGDVIFDPWVKSMVDRGVKFQTSTYVSGFEMQNERRISGVQCKLANGRTIDLEADDVVFAVGAKALNAIVSNSSELSKYSEFRRFANLRGTSVLATRIFLDTNIKVPYSANACWGFDPGVGMTLFDIKALHGPNAKTVEGAVGSVLEVDYYHASNLLIMSDNDIVAKVKNDLDTILGPTCQSATVVDAAVVRLPNAVNWYYPGSYKDMPDVESSSISNLFFAGDIVRTRHGSWSQEKAYVTGMEACNRILGRNVDYGVLPMSADEPHVAFGKTCVALIRKLLGGGDNDQKKGPSLVDFLW
jgi:uncharacterized protein with NAD-binding domain and iron-sulfur cluster